MRNIISRNYGVDDEEARLLAREEKRERELVSFRCGGREFQRRMVEGIKYFLKEDFFECRQIKLFG